MEISAATFDFVRTLICDQAGIILERDKQYLVEARLMPHRAQAGLRLGRRAGDAGQPDE